jgi:hypothetical protein
MFERTWNAIAICVITTLIIMCSVVGANHAQERAQEEQDWEVHE